MKSFARGLLEAVMRGRSDGLSPLGAGLERLSRFIVFRARDLRARAFHSAPALDHAEWPINPQGRWLIDVGANCGDTIPYYLARGFRVVAVEANPALIGKMAETFADAIKKGSVILQHCCITAGEESFVDLHVHQENDQLSTAHSASLTAADRYEVVRVPAKRIANFRNYDPIAVKIDIEGLDATVVKDMIGSEFLPTYLSVEAHTAEALCYLVAAGYREFKVVEGRFVSSPRFEQNIEQEGQTVRMRFDRHGAGPIGEDVPGPWLNLDQMFVYVSEHGFGWKDIHVRRL